MRCSVTGCGFESDQVATPASAPGMLLFCPAHATGTETGGDKLLLRMPCACRRSAAGVERGAGGFSARHTERICIERTIQANPEDMTVPAGLPNPVARPIDSGRVVDRKCACGKRTDGAVNISGGYTESHSVRECIEQTTR